MSGEHYGIQYIVLGIGSPECKCEDADTDVMLELLNGKIPELRAKAIRGHLADRISASMVHDALFAKPSKPVGLNSLVIDRSVPLGELTYNVVGHVIEINDDKATVNYAGHIIEGIPIEHLEAQ